MAIHEIKHPLIQHKLGLMRHHDISTKAFRELASEVGMLLTYEATRTLPTERIEIECWSGSIEVEQIRGKKITVVPILRAVWACLTGYWKPSPMLKFQSSACTVMKRPCSLGLFSEIDQRYCRPNRHGNRPHAGHWGYIGRDDRHAESSGL